MLTSSNKLKSAIGHCFMDNDRLRFDYIFSMLVSVNGIWRLLAGWRKSDYYA